MTRITGTLYEDQYKFFFISFSLILKVRKVSTKLYRKSKSTFLCSINVVSENRAVYEIISKNIVETGRSQMTIWLMRITFCIPKATDTP